VTKAKGEREGGVWGNHNRKRGGTKKKKKKKKRKKVKKVKGTNTRWRLPQMNQEGRHGAV